MGLKFDRRYSSRQTSVFNVVLVSAFIGACLMISIILGTGYAISQLDPTPEIEVALLVTETPTATATAPVATAVLPPTSTPTSTATAPPPAPPTDPPPPTGYFRVPANLTPRPTPVLPAAAPLPSSCDGPGRMNILVIGVDSRGSTFSGRSDVIMVAGVNFSDKTIQMLSIPRDLWVQIPIAGGLQENRINTAFPQGGAAMLAETISANFGLRIDRYVIVNFTTFINGIDAIGGIDVYLDTAVYDSAYPMGNGNTMVLEIPAGWVHMDGEVALMYSRTRHGDSDFGRMRRQQKVIMAIREKLLRPEVFPALPALVQLGYSSVQTNLSFEDVALLGCVGPQVGEGGITRVVIDQTMTSSVTRESGAQVLMPIMDAILPQLAAFNTGE